MIWAGLVLIAVLIILRYLPVRKEVLIEGVFDRESDDVDFYERLRVFWFDNYCRSCFEHGLTDKSSLYGQCFTAVPASAFEKGNLELRRGESIKITAWKTVFGRIKLYYLTETNFADETCELQLKQEEKEREAYDEAVDARHALEMGMTVEEFHESERQKSIATAARVLDLTEEEVVRLGYNNIPSFSLGSVGDLRAVLGREPTSDEIFEAKIKDLEEFSKRISRELTPEEADNEGELYIKVEEEFRQLVDKKMEMIIAPPGPVCLTEDDLGGIRATGNISSIMADHMKACESCQIKASTSRRAWLDRVAPYPRMPRLRLPSVRYKYETA